MGSHNVSATRPNFEAQARRIVSVLPGLTAGDMTHAIKGHREMHQTARQRLGDTPDVEAYGTAIDDMQAALDEAVREVDGQRAGELTDDERVGIIREGLEAKHAKQAVYHAIMGGQ